MNSEAYILHKQWSGETSVRVTFFTRDQGIVVALYKGGRTLKKQAMLQAFTPLWAEFHEKNGWYYVQHLELQAQSLLLTAHNLFAGLYVNELLYLALQPAAVEDVLYEAYVSAIQSLSTANTRIDIEMILRRFEWCWLTELGYAMSLTHEAISYLSIIPTGYYTFKPGLGFVVATEGILGEHILAIAEFRMDSFAILKTAKQIMRRAVDHALGGKVIKARDLYLV